VICLLAGGVGAAKVLRGLQSVEPEEEIVAIVNTGDDQNFYGLAVSPDLDTVTYTLAGLSNDITGWGVRGETFQALEMLRTLGDDAWFALGDRDLGTHLYRTRRLGEGALLSEVTDEIRRAHGITTRLIPMSNTPVRTLLRVSLPYQAAPSPNTETLWMSFQDYFVKHRHEPVVDQVTYSGCQDAHVPEAALEALTNARRIIIAPSNPVLSIGPILSVPGIAQLLRQRRRDSLAISPIVNGKALKGPADRILESLYGDSSVRTIAKLYKDFAVGLVIDSADSAYVSEIEHEGVLPIVTSTIMSNVQDEQTLGRFLLEY
jgi:LPPG:FO 2-phospho-L-lactate transferase